MCSQRGSKIRKINSTSPNLTRHSLVLFKIILKKFSFDAFRAVQLRILVFWDVTNCSWTEAKGEAFLCPLKHKKTLTQQCSNTHMKNRIFKIKIQSKRMGDAYMCQSQKHSWVPIPNKIYVNFCCYHTAWGFFVISAMLCSTFRVTQFPPELPRMPMNTTEICKIF